MDDEDAPASLEAALTGSRVQGGANLWDLSQQRPLLMVCLRHQGCTFCRETLSDLARRRETIEGRGVAIVLVHMVGPQAATSFFDACGLGDVASVSDPDRRLYRALGLKRGRGMAA